MNEPRENSEKNLRKPRVWNLAKNEQNLTKPNIYAKSRQRE